jgi:hypothetical protein
MTPFASENITSSASVSSFSLRMTCARCVSTVRTDEGLLADLLIRVAESQQVQDV